jgi:hypothetical protein
VCCRHPQHWASAKFACGLRAYVARKPVTIVGASACCEQNADHSVPQDPADTEDVGEIMNEFDEAFQADPLKAVISLSVITQPTRNASKKLTRTKERITYRTSALHFCFGSSTSENRFRTADAIDR